MGTNNGAELPAYNLPPEVIKDPAIGIISFFSCESPTQIKEKIEFIKETLITESYGELDKDDKWGTIEMLRRLSNLVDVADCVLHKPPLA